MNSPSVHSTAPPPGAPLSVSRINRLVRSCLEENFPLFWVTGEISNLTYAASGHVYFTLKDDAAQVRCVMWRSRAQLLGWRLANGQQIDARALVSFYEPRGEFQLSIEQVRRAGQGDLFEQFLRLKQQLEHEGLFAQERKRPLPVFPRKIAVVTSPQAAALRDVLSTLARRSPQVEVRLYPSPVQGDGAAAQLAAALAEAQLHDNELILLCRGGGSIEDLWAFNEEVLARAITTSRLPVISGVGHETDFTIADFVADLRAPTPTAAAELACPEQTALLAHVDSLQARLQRRSAGYLAQLGQQLDRLSDRLTHPAERLRQQRSYLTDCLARLQRASQRLSAQRQRDLQSRLQLLSMRRPKAERQQAQLSQLAHRLQQCGQRELLAAHNRLNGLNTSLEQLNPHAVLARGYAYALDETGKAIRTAGALSPGQGLQLHLSEGQASVTVNAVAVGKSS